MSANPDEFDFGDLLDQITWQRKGIAGQNASGEDIYTWVDLLTCKARIQSSRSLIAKNPEFQQVMQRWAEADFIITQHFSPGLSADMRISWFTDGAVVYLDVLGVDDHTEEIVQYQTVACRTFEGGFTA